MYVCVCDCNETRDSNLFKILFYIRDHIIIFFSFDAPYRYSYIKVSCSSRLMGFSRIRFVLKRKRSYGVTYKLDFQVHFFPKKELQYRLYNIHYTLYRLQYRRTLTHRCTLKSILRQFVAIVVRRAFSFFVELQMEIKTLLLCTLKLYILYIYCFPILSSFHSHCIHTYK